MATNVNATILAVRLWFCSELGSGSPRVVLGNTNASGGLESPTQAIFADRESASAETVPGM